MNAKSSDEVPSQRDRFIEAARKLGADEDEAAFKAKLAVIAKQKPKDEPIADETNLSGRKQG